MNDNDKSKTGFESIGERIEKLKDNIDTTEQTNHPKVSSSSHQVETEASKKSYPEVYPEPIKYKPSFKFSFAKIFWGVIAIIIIAAIFSENTGEKGAHPPSNDDFIADGQYRCTQSHHNRAQELKPSITESQNIERQKQILNREANDLDLLKSQIETDYVDHYSQSSVNQHNSMVRDYNSRLEMFNINTNILQRRIDNYNTQISNYNNYLLANCRKAN